MTSQIFIDASVPIYAGGRAHPLKQPCVDILRFVVQERRSFITDAEVFQELLHRYLSIREWHRGKPVFNGFFYLMSGRIEAMLPDDVRYAAELSGTYPSLSARDLVHIAVMSRVGATRIVSADQGFDGVADIQRLDPADFEQWRDTVRA